MIDISPDNLQLIISILEQFAPDCEARAFGSRTDGTAKRFSDLDIALVCPDEIDNKQIGRLREAFALSDLPIKIDISDWKALPESFKRNIGENYIVIKQPKPA